MSNFSVLLPVYYADNPLHFDLSIKSIFSSTVIPSELVIVEDGPLPSSLNVVVKKYCRLYPDFIKLVKLDKNKGLGEALNCGVRACSQGLIARMDADDICQKDRFEKQLEVFEKDKNIAIVGSNIDEYDDDMVNLIGYRIVPEKNDDIKKFLRKRNPFNHMSVMFRKNAVMMVGGYLPMDGFEDYYLWCRLLKEYDGYNIQESLVKVRGGDSMYKRRGGKSYAKKIIVFQSAICKDGVINKRQKIMNDFVRVPIAIAPLWLKRIFYENILRGSKA